MNNHHHHRSGWQTQSNKRHKTSLASKRAAGRRSGAGRINNVTNSHKKHLNNVRRTKVRTSQRNARQAAVVANRRLVSHSIASIVDGRLMAEAQCPRLIGIISLSEISSPSIVPEPAVLEASLQSYLLYSQGSKQNNYTCMYNHLQHTRLTVLTPQQMAPAGPEAGQTWSEADKRIHAALALTRIVDAVVFIFDGTHEDEDAMVSEEGDRILVATKAQGLPRSVFTVLADYDHGGGGVLLSSSSSSTKKRYSKNKKYAQRLTTSEFGDSAKLFFQDLSSAENNKQPSSSSNLVRTLCTSTLSASTHTMTRPYIVSENVEYNDVSRELSLTGYIRGSAPLNVNSLVHIPFVGTYQAVKMVQMNEVLPVKKRHGNTQEVYEQRVADVSKQENLERFAQADALEGEQNLIGFDEEFGDDNSMNSRDHDGESSDFQKGKARPAGWSDYQAAWLGDDDYESVIGNDTEDQDHGELAHELNTKSESLVDEDMMNNPEERMALIEKRRKDHKDDLEFPDEIELDEDQNAGERLARYRSLKSFRKSEWDPKENLPLSYASIYHFSSFKSTQRDVFSEIHDTIKEQIKINEERRKEKKNKSSDGDIDMHVEGNGDEDDDILDGCFAPGTYVKITLGSVDLSKCSWIDTSSCLPCAVSLLPHENKVSVLHMNVCQTAKCEPGDIPVKSKDLLTFQCGWRTWKARPVFSQNNLNCDKHKFERFLSPNMFLAASTFGPVTYGNAPVLVYREPTADQPNRQLVATGTVIGADADRLILKRVILTGYPTRVHKRHATVKYMFFTPDDVRWFKPAGLTTKHGLQGNIMESVGEHGVMKCLFNKPIKQHDTVCLALYKRIFPKFEEEENNKGLEIN